MSGDVVDHSVNTSTIVILANKVPVKDDEIMDYIIEGIPDSILRDQARIQKLNLTSSLMLAQAGSF